MIHNPIIDRKANYIIPLRGIARKPTRLTTIDGVPYVHFSHR